MHSNNSKWTAKNSKIHENHQNSKNQNQHFEKNSKSGKNGGNVANYNLDIQSILNGNDSRTTIMIKNIPNKYSQAMLLESFDRKQKEQYDFFYLPIDFKN